MSKPEIAYARLKLERYHNAFQLEDAKYETPARLYEVLKEEFYMNPLTQELAQLHPDILGPWRAYNSHVGDWSNLDVPTVRAVAKFEIQDEKVTLLDIRFN